MYMENEIILKDRLIDQIVERLRKYGFVHVNRENISTDEVYSQYFLRILNESPPWHCHRYPQTQIAQIRK